MNPGGASRLLPLLCGALVAAGCAGSRAKLSPVYEDGLFIGKISDAQDSGEQPAKVQPAKVQPVKQPPVKPTPRLKMKVAPEPPCTYDWEGEGYLDEIDWCLDISPQDTDLAKVRLRCSLN